MSSDLAGLAAVVTGGSQGIGLAIAHALARRGASLAVVGKDEDHLREVVPALEQIGDGSVRPFCVDLSNRTAVEQVADDIIQQFGAVDILVNNAGVRTIDPITEINVDDWERTFAVNVTAPLQLIRAFAPGMIAKGHGRIINVASVAGSLPFRNRAGYNSSKAALLALTKSVALELGVHGIRCNSVSPGIVETQMNRESLQDESVRSIGLENTPVGHFGSPEDIAAPVLFLCSDEARYINGADLPADGGWLSGKGY